MKTKKAFCSGEQKVTDHTVTVDQNGEFVFACECGRFFKLPGDLDKEGVSDALKIHEESNKGQVTNEQLEKERAEKLKNI